MSEAQPNPAASESPELIEQLSAYLDGELDAEQSQLLEQRLATDAGARAELQRLERAWELLDRLPRAEVEPSFTQTTVAMVAVRAAEDVAQEQSPARSRLPLAGLLVACGAVAAAVAGFVAVFLLSRDPNRTLLADLPLVEHLSAYQAAGNIDFLRRLHATGLFASAPGAPAVAVPSEAPSERERYVAALPEAARQALKAETERYENLAAAERRGLAEFCAVVAADPNAAALRQTLVNFDDWLKSLPSDRAPSVAARLFDDLPIIEQMEAYEQAQSVQFLRDLRAGNLFLADPDPLSVAPREPTDDRARMRSECDRFFRQDPAQQAWLREFHAELNSDPSAAELQATLRRYHHWLLALPAGRENDLRTLAPDKRLDRIRFILSHQLAPADQKVVAQWIVTTVKRLPESDRRRVMLRLSGGGWPLAVEPGKWPTPQDLQELTGSLSPEAERQLTRAATAQQKYELLSAWVRQSLASQAFDFAGGRLAVSDAELWRFYREELSDGERAELQAHPDEFFTRLRRMYYLRRYLPLPGPPGGQRPFRPGGERGGMPGAPRDGRPRPDAR